MAKKKTHILVEATNLRINRYDTIWDKVVCCINQRVGSTITTRVLQRAVGDCYIRTVPNYMCRLRRAGFVERIKRGEYKVIKPCNLTILEVQRKCQNLPI